MLETGATCLVCNKRKYKKDFTRVGVESGCCNTCSLANSERDKELQRELQALYVDGDTKIDCCLCGRYYVNEKEKSDGTFVIFEECLKCRATVTLTKEALSTGQVSGTVQKPLLEKKSEDVLEEKSDGIPTKPLDKKNSNDLSAMPTDTRKNKMSTSEELETRTGSNTSNDSELITTKENTSQESLSVEESTTLQLDSKAISTALKRETLASTALLSDSAKSLINYATRIARPLTVAQDNGEILREAPVSQIMEAAKCFDMARNTMKTKLEFMKFMNQIGGK